MPRSAFRLEQRFAIEHETQVGRAFQIDGIGQARAQKRSRARERTLDVGPLPLGDFRRACDRKMDASMPVVDRKNDGEDSNRPQCRIGNVIAQERAKLFKNQTLQAKVPVSDAFISIFSSHERSILGRPKPPWRHSMLRSRGEQT